MTTFCACECTIMCLISKSVSSRTKCGMHIYFLLNISQLCPVITYKVKKGLKLELELIAHLKDM